MIALVVALFVLGAVWVGVSRLMSTDRSETTQVLTAAHHMVEAKLATNSMVRFGSPEETIIEQQPDKAYVVRGGVQVIDGAGRTSGYSYSCTLAKDAGGRWAAKSVDLVEGM